jgi:hypothetical protein
MTHGLDHLSAVLHTRGAGAGVTAPRSRGGRGRGRGNSSRRGGVSSGHTKASKLFRPRVIKCDKCGYEFPAEVNERILVEHITKYHMKQQLQPDDRLKSSSPQKTLPVLQVREHFSFFTCLGE